MGKRHCTRDELARIFGDNLRAARRERDLTQAQVAESISVSNEFYARLERGRALPSTETLCALVKVLDVSADSLFGEAIKPLPVGSILDELPPKRAQLARRIMALEVDAQRVVGLLLVYCERRSGGGKSS